MKIIYKFFDKRRKADKGKKKEYYFGLSGTSYIINLADPRYHFLLWDWQFLCDNHHKVPNKAKFLYRIIMASVRTKKYYARNHEQIKRQKWKYDVIYLQNKNFRRK